MRRGMQGVRIFMTVLLVTKAWAGVAGGGPDRYTNKAYFDDEFEIQGENSYVYALAKDGLGNVYAGGDFTRADKATINHMAKWDGSAWSPLGDGMNGEIRALAVDGSGNLYAGGRFTTAGGIAAKYMAKWDGTSWSALGTGVDAPVCALAVDTSGTCTRGDISGRRAISS